MWSFYDVNEYCKKGFLKSLWCFWPMILIVRSKWSKITLSIHLGIIIVYVLKLLYNL